MLNLCMLKHVDEMYPFDNSGEFYTYVYVSMCHICGNNLLPVIDFALLPYTTPYSPFPAKV